MKAEIIAVGSELLTPDRVDTNSLFLTAQLNRLGVEVTRKAVIGEWPIAINKTGEDCPRRLCLRNAFEPVYPRGG